MSKGVFLTEYFSQVSDEEKDEFSQIEEWKDRIKYFWNHPIFDHILTNSFASGKNDGMAEVTLSFADQLLEEGKLQGALDFYNTAVIFSKYGSQHFGKALESRSYCLYRMNNMDMAIQAGCLFMSIRHKGVYRVSHICTVISIKIKIAKTSRDPHPSKNNQIFF